MKHHEIDAGIERYLAGSGSSKDPHERAQPLLDALTETLQGSR